MGLGEGSCRAYGNETKLKKRITKQPKINGFQRCLVLFGDMQKLPV